MGRKTKMLPLFPAFLATCLFASSTGLSDEQSWKLRFRSGWIVAAEQTSSGPDIGNVSKYEPPSRITSDVAYVAVAVRPDQGRKLSIYDYVLRRGFSEYPCIALREGNGRFDASNWIVENTDPKKTYTMLFRVQSAPQGQPPDLDLKFNLAPPHGTEPKLMIHDIGTAQFTDPGKIPEGGIYAKHLMAKEEPKAATKTEAGKTEAAKPPEPANEPPPATPPKGDQKLSKEEIDKFNDMLKTSAKTATTKNIAVNCEIKASSETDGNAAKNAVDGNMATRWESAHGADPQSIEMVLTKDRSVDVTDLVIHWETAFAKKYEVYTGSKRGEWNLLLEEKNGDGGEDKIAIGKKIKYVKIVGLQRSTQYGYSVFEIEVHKK